MNLTATDKRPGHFVFIVNPQAGRRRSQNMIRRIKSSLSGAPDLTVEFAITEAPGHATVLAADYAARYGASAIIFACGGDGTANEVVQGLAGTDAVMSIIPIGTANDFCRAAFSTIKLKTLYSRLAVPQIKPIDLIGYDNGISLNIVSLGLDTMIQILAQKLTRRWHLPGSIVYPLAIVAGLAGKRQFDMRFRFDVVAEDGRIGEITGDSRFILAAICNGRYYGGGFNPAPDARLDDGRLQVCLVDSLPLRKILPLIPLYKKGRHLGQPAIHAWTVLSGELTAEAEPLPGNADGEIFHRADIRFRVLPHHLKFAFY